MRRSWRDAAAFRIAGVYLLVSIVWILGSDTVLELTVEDADTRALIQSYKGLGFVLLTSLVLYLVVHRYVDRLGETNDRLRLAYDQTLAGWAAALDIRDRSTAMHTQRVTAMTVELARRVGIHGRELDDVRRGATLHDIGKMGVADSILSKPGPLDDDEWVQMRRHPELARAMLQDIEYLRSALDIPWCHHEKWDGSGYPRGLAGEAIPLPARLFAVVDVFDALTSERPYRRPMSPQDALELIQSESGSHFDPSVVETFCAMLRDPHQGPVRAHQVP